MTAVLKIPLFPLNVVLLPELPLPLHIFEERYKEMIGNCLETDKLFGVVFMQGKQMRRVGCTAKIIQVLKQYDDGCLDILTVGKQRFNILEISEEKTYLESKVELFDDIIEEDSPQTTALKQKGMALLQQLEKTMQLRANPGRFF
jgi:Lon protease-like protein